MERFAADRMLGKLAKWMRVLGFDVVYLRKGGDEEIFLCLKEGRTLLTRKHGASFREQQGKVFIVSANDPKKQLREVYQGLGLCKTAVTFLSRCLNCNRLLEAISKEEVREEVPEYIWQSQSLFYRCEDCGKVYWPGSHAKKMRQHLHQILSNNE